MIETKLVERLNKNIGKKRITRLEYAKVIDFQGFLQHNLTVADKASMTASVEIRVPCLSENIIFSIFGSKKKYSKFYNKSFLIDFLSKSVPHKYFSRNKQGFNPPLNLAVMRLGEDAILKNLKKTPLFSYLDEKVISKIVYEHFSCKVDKTYQIWQLIFLSQWLLVWDKSYGAIRLS